ncbi:MAG: hypothetical protein WCD70_05045 [Alphaproteobacteria bacterium]
MADNHPAKTRLPLFFQPSLQARCAVAQILAEDARQSREAVAKHRSAVRAHDAAVRKDLKETLICTGMVAAAQVISFNPLSLHKYQGTAVPHNIIDTWIVAPAKYAVRAVETAWGIAGIAVTGAITTLDKARVGLQTRPVMQDVKPKFDSLKLP